VGDLEMCSLDVWKYKWESMSINAQAVARARHSQASKQGKTDAKENR